MKQRNKIIKKNTYILYKQVFKATRFDRRPKEKHAQRIGRVTKQRMPRHGNDQHTVDCHQLYVSAGITNKN